MSRLTKKFDNDEMHYDMGDQYATTPHDGIQYIIDVNNKLGKLEDIEDELGIDLETFVKLTKAKEIYDIEEDDMTTFTYVDFEKHLIVCVDDFDEMSERYLEWSYRFEDFGKTWAFARKEPK